MIYADLASDLARRFPEIRARLQVEAELWDPDPVGGDVLLADIFVPYFVKLLRAKDPAISPASMFVEELASSDDPLLHEAAQISVLQALEEYYTELPHWIPLLGPNSRAMLPTRE